MLLGRSSVFWGLSLVCKPWVVSGREFPYRISYLQSLISLQDPVKDGEEKIKKDFDDLLEQMQQGFRNLED